MTNNIIRFPVEKINTTSETRSKSDSRPKITELRQDYFQKSAPARRISYTLEEMRELVGEKRADEIFSTMLRGAKEPKSSVMSPPNGEVPLRKSLAYVWDNSKETQDDKKAKLGQIARLKRAFGALEKECSKKHEELYGERADIKITFYDYDEDEEFYLTDMLEKQADFYRKGKIAASFDLIGQRINHGLDCFLDKIIIDED